MSKDYPTIEEVEKADHYQLGVWARCLPSPGWNSIASENFHEIHINERDVLQRIIERFEAFGGWNPQLSKQIGWDHK